MMQQHSNPNTDTDTEKRKGMAVALGAYLFWGLVPIFWKQIPGMPSYELMSHRVIWCAAFVLGYLVIKGEGRFWHGVDRKTAALLLVTGCLLGLNGWLYIWAVSNGRIVEGSLGYFINPLVNVLFGVLFLRERLRSPQWLAVGIAAVGVAYLTYTAGSFPWIAITLSISFGTYGLIRKLLTIDVFRGLLIESLWLAPLAVVVMWHAASFPSDSGSLNTLLLMCGPVTAIPLLMFAYGAKRIPYSLLGILQYIAPSMQLLLAVWLYHESFPLSKWIGYGFIWLSLVIYTGHSLATQRKTQTLREL